jgi:DNA end-binding protein Ku
VPNEDIVKGLKVDTDTYVEVTKEELDNVALESTRTIEIDEFVARDEIDPRYIIRPDKGLMGTLLRYPYEVRAEEEYFDEIQDVKVTKDMLDLAKHIVNQKAGRFEPAKFEDQYEAALVDLINKKRAGQPITKKDRPAAGNVVDLMEALRRSVGGAEPAKASKSAKKPRKVAGGQKEMLMPIEGTKTAKEATAKKTASKPQRKSALHGTEGVLNDQGQGHCDGCLHGIGSARVSWREGGCRAVRQHGGRFRCLEEPVRGGGKRKRRQRL